MKLGTFLILLIFVPEFGIAQEKASRENVAMSVNEQVIALQSPADGSQRTPSIAPANSSIVELSALYARSKFTSDPDLYREIKQTDQSEPGIIEDWRERIFNTLKTRSNLRQSDLVNDSRLQSKNELDEKANETRMVARIVLKETLKFTQERVPEIDKLVKVLKLEVSTDMISGEDAGAKVDGKKTDETRAANNTKNKDKLSIKTGLRVPVESGKAGLVSETEARYGNMSSFVKVIFDGQYDNTVGLIYILGKDLRLQVERQVTHTTDPVTSDKTNAKSSLDLIQLVCKF